MPTMVKVSDLCKYLARVYEAMDERDEEIERLNAELDERRCGSCAVNDSGYGDDPDPDPESNEFWEEVDKAMAEAGLPESVTDKVAGQCCESAPESTFAALASPEPLGPDAEPCVNASGGKQSALPFRLDLLPASAALRIGKILAEGAAKYGEDNWRKIPTRDHLNHAMVHVMAALSGNTADDHLGHAACRMLMALEMHLSETRKEAA